MGKPLAHGKRKRPVPGQVKFQALLQRQTSRWSTHYIDISEDLHDLAEKTKIVTNTDSESLARMLREIAANARALMQEFTYKRRHERFQSIE